MTFARNYILTINNPEMNEAEFYEFCTKLDHIKYFIFQREKGTETETEHYQVYIEFCVSKRFDTIKGYFPTAHIEKRNGTKMQAKEYCSKEETRMGDVFEYGELVFGGSGTCFCYNRA